MTMNRWVFGNVLISLLTLAATGISRGNDSDTLKSLENVVVTGTKTEKNISFSAIKTDLVSREDIERFASCNLYQILNGTPGIRVEQQCNNCNFSLLRMSGLEGGYAKILIDGMPVYSGLAGVYGMQQIQASLIERIEIVRGAGSALYGSDAIAGVINVITRKPSPQPSMDIGVSVGGNPIDEKNRKGGIPKMSNVSFSASQRKGDFAAVIAGQSNTADEIDNNGDYATDNVQSKNLGGTAKLFWYNLLGDKSTIGLMGRAMYEQRKGGGLQKDEKGNYFIDDPLSPEGPGSEHIITERFEAGLNIEKEFTTSTILNVFLNVVSHERSATNAAAWEKMLEEAVNMPSITEDDIKILSKMSPKPFLTSERTVVGEINAAQQLFSNNTLLAGVQVKRTNVNENINGDGWFERYFQDIGIFIQDEWDIIDKFGVVAGLRYDMHKSEDEFTSNVYDENAVNPRISLRVTPIKEVVTRLSWGTGFRVPGDFSEDAHLCASAPRIMKSQSLEPERSMGLNASVDYTKNGVRAGLNLFRTDIENKVVLGEYSGDGGAYDLEWENADGKAFTQGFELSGGYEKSFYKFEAGYNFNDARYEDKQIPGNDRSKYIPRSPRHNAHLDIGLFSDRTGRGFTDGWSFDLGMRFIGFMYIERDAGVVEEYADQNLEAIVETDPYVLADARINKRINSADLDIYIAAENLTNTVQKRKKWDIDDAAMVYAPLYGTTISVGIKKQF
ncbi:MAG: TonB-dependent receptor [Chitinispirillaceae bacterium]|nr:TonB-dependent receptor [Chitinispirillaceae bacterium]